MRPSLVLAAAAAIAALAAPFTLQAKDDWPSKPLRIIVPFPAGSGTDSSARAVGQALSKRLGQPVVVDNKAGANGVIAAQEAARAAPDGYTFFITTMTTHAVNVHLYKKLPYDPVKDFEPVSLIARSPLVLVVRNTADTPKTLAELTQRIKASPGKLSFGSGSTSTRAGGELYKTMAHLDVLHVPYKGTPQALTDLVGGQIDFMFPDLSPAVPLVQQGQLRALAVTSARRVKSLPDVPTMAEAGIPGFELTAWAAAFAPAHTPKDIIQRVNLAIQEYLKSKEAEEFFARTGSEAVPTTPEGLGSYVQSEIQKWGDIVRRANMQVD